MIDPGTAMLISTGASMLGGLFGNKKKATSGVTGPQVITLPQYSFTEPRLRTTSDFIAENIERMARGEYPAYYEKAMPRLRENLSRENYKTYYGREGERTGAVNAAMEAASITGIGPRAANAQATKQIRDYADKEREIDEYLAKMGVDIMQRDAYSFPQLSAGMPKGPDTQVIPGQGYSTPESPNYFGQAMEGVAAALPYLASYNQPNYGPVDIGGGRTAPPPGYDLGINPWANSAKPPVLPMNVPMPIGGGRTAPPGNFNYSWGEGVMPWIPPMASAPMSSAPAGRPSFMPSLNFDWQAILKRAREIMAGSVDPSYEAGAFQRNNYTVPGY